MRPLDRETKGIRTHEQAAAQARVEILSPAQSQQYTLATSFADLLGDGGPSNETADEMIQAIREWRDRTSNRCSPSQTAS